MNKLLNHVQTEKNIIWLNKVSNLEARLSWQPVWGDPAVRPQAPGRRTEGSSERGSAEGRLKYKDQHATLQPSSQWVSRLPFSQSKSRGKCSNKTGSNFESFIFEGWEFYLPFCLIRNTRREKIDGKTDWTWQIPTRTTDVSLLKKSKKVFSLLGELSDASLSKWSLYF